MPRRREVGTRSSTVVQTVEWEGRIFQARMQSCSSPYCRQGCPGVAAHGPYWWEQLADGFRRWWSYFGTGRTQPLPWADDPASAKPILPAAEDPTSRMNLRRKTAEQRRAERNARRREQRAARRSRSAAPQ